MLFYVVTNVLDEPDVSFLRVYFDYEDGGTRFTWNTIHLQAVLWYSLKEISKLKDISGMGMGESLLHGACSYISDFLPLAGKKNSITSFWSHF